MPKAITLFILANVLCLSLMLGRALIENGIIDANWYDTFEEIVFWLPFAGIVTVFIFSREDKNRGLR